MNELFFDLNVFVLVSQGTDDGVALNVCQTSSEFLVTTLLIKEALACDHLLVRPLAVIAQKSTYFLVCTVFEVDHSLVKRWVFGCRTLTYFVNVVLQGPGLDFGKSYVLQIYVLK